MKKMVVWLLVGLFVTAVAGPALAADKCANDQVKAAVDKMAGVLTAKGKAGFAEVKAYRFCGANYVWVVDQKFNMLCHPSPALANKNVATVRDDKGKMFNMEALAGLKTKNEVWVQYRWYIPPDMKTWHAKCAYYKKIKTKDGEMIVSAGAYRACGK